MGPQKSIIGHFKLDRISLAPKNRHIQIFITLYLREYIYFNLQTSQHLPNFHSSSNFFWFPPNKSNPNFLISNFGRRDTLVSSYHGHRCGWMDLHQFTKPLRVVLHSQYLELLLYKWPPRRLNTSGFEGE